MEVYAVCSWMNCEEDHDGQAVVEVFTTEQTARQDLERRGGHSFGYVTTLRVRTALR